MKKIYLILIAAIIATPLFISETFAATDDDWESPTAVTDEVIVGGSDTVTAEDDWESPTAVTDDIIIGGTDTATTDDIIIGGGDTATTDDIILGGTDSATDEEGVILGGRDTESPGEGRAHPRAAAGTLLRTYLRFGGVTIINADGESSHQLWLTQSPRPRGNGWIQRRYAVLL